MLFLHCHVARSFEVYVTERKTKPNTKKNKNLCIKEELKSWFMSLFHNLTYAAQTTWIIFGFVRGHLYFATFCNHGLDDFDHLAVGIFVSTKGSSNLYSLRSTKRVPFNFFFPTQFARF